MRVNVYAEEMTDRVEIISKQIDGHDFTGLRIYLELPVSVPVNVPLDTLQPPPGQTDVTPREGDPSYVNVSGPFRHRVGDDDSSAVTFWGKRDLREVLRKALALLDEHYEKSPPKPAIEVVADPSMPVGHFAFVDRPAQRRVPPCKCAMGFLGVDPDCPQHGTRKAER